jgi:hypothetical protein
MYSVSPFNDGRGRHRGAAETVCLDLGNATRTVKHVFQTQHHHPRIGGTAHHGVRLAAPRGAVREHGAVVS